MVLVKDVLISDDILQEEFICNLSACKGACCWEGDYGAPLTLDEMQSLVDDREAIIPYLNPKFAETINTKGGYQYYDEPKFYGTTLEASGACSYLVVKDGISYCGIEKAYDDGAIIWRKPISCYLYPIRVTKNEDTGFEAWNYDRWEICKAACANGKKHSVKVFEFLKKPIVDYKGTAFYEELEAAAKYLND